MYKPVYDTILDLPPCSIEFVPSIDNVFAIGSYNYNEKSKERDGRIEIASISNEMDTLKFECMVKTEGILDAAWYPYGDLDNDILAIATSSGNIIFYSFTSIDSKYNLYRIHTQEYGNTSTCPIALCINYEINNPNEIPKNPRISVGYSNGDASIYSINTKINDSRDIKSSLLWNTKVSDMEVWATAVRNNTLFTGADDSLLKLWDIRMDKKPTITSRKHDAGVTVITPHPIDENIIATGSYDDNLRIWDIRNMKSCKSKIDMKGGIWRIKWNKNNLNELLVAAMYSGFRYITLDENYSVLNLEELHGKHSNIAYGIDSSNKGMVTCSFYDKVVTLWSK